MIKTEFQRELESLINRHSAENDSDTPDFILATYLARCLETFNDAVNSREVWYGRQKRKTPIELAEETKEL